MTVAKANHNLLFTIQSTTLSQPTIAFSIRNPSIWGAGAGGIAEQLREEARASVETTVGDCSPQHSLYDKDW